MPLACKIGAFAIFFAFIVDAIPQVIETPARFRVEDGVMSAGSADALRTKVLRNVASGEEATIIWESGGRTEGLLLASKRHPGVLHDVLSGHDGNATAVRVNSHWAGCPLLPWANRIANGTYTFEGVTHHLPINEVAGRRDALHGLLCNKTMVVQKQWASGTEAGVRLGYSFDGSVNTHMRAHTDARALTSPIPSLSPAQHPTPPT